MSGIIGISLADAWLFFRLLCRCWSGSGCWRRFCSGFIGRPCGTRWVASSFRNLGSSSQWGPVVPKSRRRCDPSSNQGLRCWQSTQCTDNSSWWSCSFLWSSCICQVGDVCLSFPWDQQSTLFPQPQLFKTSKAPNSSWSWSRYSALSLA